MMKLPGDITVSQPASDARDSSEERSEQIKFILVDTKKSVKSTRPEEMSVEAVDSENV